MKSSDSDRLNAYAKALKATASEDAFKMSNRRYQGFMKLPAWQQLTYIEWINKMAREQPAKHQWCVDIVMTFAGIQLGLDE